MFQIRQFHNLISIFFLIFFCSTLNFKVTTHSRANTLKNSSNNYYNSAQLAKLLISTSTIKRENFIDLNNNPNNDNSNSSFNRQTDILTNDDLLSFSKQLSTNSTTMSSCRPSHHQNRNYYPQQSMMRTQNFSNGNFNTKISTRTLNATDSPKHGHKNQHPHHHHQFNNLTINRLNYEQEMNNDADFSATSNRKSSEYYDNNVVENELSKMLNENHVLRFSDLFNELNPNLIPANHTTTRTTPPPPPKPPANLLVAQMNSGSMPTTTSLSNVSTPTSTTSASSSISSPSSNSSAQSKSLLIQSNQANNNNNNNTFNKFPSLPFNNYARIINVNNNNNNNEFLSNSQQQQTKHLNI
jgi:hypothetical protein